MQKAPTEAVFSSRDMSWARSKPGWNTPELSLSSEHRQLSNIQATLRHSMTQVSTNHTTGASKPVTRHFCPARPPKGKNQLPFTEQTAHTSSSEIPHSVFVMYFPRFISKETGLSWHSRGLFMKAQTSLQPHPSFYTSTANTGEARVQKKHN